MKILALSYLYPNQLYPHYGIFVHNRLKAVSCYHEVKVVNPIPWFPYCSRLDRYKNYDQIPAREVIDGIEVFHPRFVVIPKFFKFIDAITYRRVVVPLVEEIVKHYQFDLLDLHWTYPDLPTGVELKKIYGKQMIVTLRGREAFHSGEGRIREGLIKKSLLGANAVISLSQELQNLAIQAGVDKNRCHIIRNGVDTSAFYYMNKNECRKKLGLPLDGKILLSVGSLNFRKGFDRIIKSLTRLLQYDKKWKLYIIGSEGPDGNYRLDLERLIESKRLTERVVFVGSIGNNQLKYWYNSADVYCLASRGEGSPNVLTEALACGCPVVATAVGSVREIVHEKFGVVVESSTDGIESGLMGVCASIWDRHYISEQVKKYDWDWCSKKVMAVYKDIVS